MIHNCPLMQNIGDMKKPNPGTCGNTRMFALTHEEVNQQQGTMAGMLTVSNIPAYVLFDTGTTHSFMSAKFHVVTGSKSIRVEEPLMISIPFDKIISAHSMVRNVRINVNEHVLEADLYVLDMKNFGIILGMDWLSKYRADIKCRERKVILHTPSDKKTTFYGVESRTVPRVISAMKAMTMCTTLSHPHF
ncbi:hypothetical protein ACS0TY_030906 [Phlomoides rotata]